MRDSRRRGEEHAGKSERQRSPANSTKWRRCIRGFIEEATARNNTAAIRTFRGRWRPRKRMRGSTARQLRCLRPGRRTRGSRCAADILCLPGVRIHVRNSRGARSLPGVQRSAGNGLKPSSKAFLASAIALVEVVQGCDSGNATWRHCLRIGRRRNFAFSEQVALRTPWLSLEAKATSRRAFGLQ